MIKSSEEYIKQARVDFANADKGTIISKPMPIDFLALCKMLDDIKDTLNEITDSTPDLRA